MLQTILEFVFSLKGIAALVSLTGAGLGLLAGSHEVRRRRIALGIHHAFNIVEDIDTERGDATLDKAVAGLRALDAWMLANGWRPLKPREQELAKLGFSSIHGMQRAVTATAEAALAAALPKATAVLPQTPPALP